MKESVSMPMGAANNVEGQVCYDPENITVPKTTTIEWINDDDVMHTVTSSLDFGETFDSGIIDPGNTFVLDTANLELGQYEYMCIVHPWMIGTVTVE